MTVSSSVVNKGWLPLIPPTCLHGVLATLHCLTTHKMITALNIAMVEALLNIMRVTIWCKMCHQAIAGGTYCLPQGEHLLLQNKAQVGTTHFRDKITNHDIGSDHGIDLDNETKAKRALEAEGKIINTTLFLMISSCFVFVGGACRSKCHMGNEGTYFRSIKRALNTIVYAQRLLGITWAELSSHGMPLPRPGMGSPPNASDVAQDWPMRTPPWREFGTEGGPSSFVDAAATDQALIFNNPTLYIPGTAPNPFEGTV
jgi:hypothetical protein